MTTLVTPTLVWALAMPDGVTLPAALRFQNTSPLTKIGLWVGSAAPDDTVLPADIVPAGQDAIVQLSAGMQLYAKAMGGGYVRGLVAIDISTASGQAERSADVDIQYEYFLATAAFADVQVGNRLRLTTLTNLSTGAVTSTWVNTSNNNAAVTNPPAASLAAIKPSMLTDEQLRAAAVPVSDPEVRAKLDLLLAALTGDPASIAALVQLQIDVQTAVKALLETIGGSTDGLEGLLTAIGLSDAQTRAVIEQVRNRLPAALGPQTAALSLSMVLAGDHPPLRVVADAPLATAAGVAEVKAAVDAVTAKLIAAPATDATLAALSDKLPATLGQKSKAESLAVTLPTDQTIPVTGPLTAEQLDAAALATDATALEAQSPMGWEEDAAGNITRVFRCLPDGAVQQHTLTPHDMGDGKTAYIPGPWQAAVGIPA